ncbi:hypothetical protein IGI04_020816 [Brassica rapa subsp. trilocularis]|uniref:Zinc finger GRF-type domain-containing protein n=1 Tax=Brassica rapa subsp. trilocularis TaxID=1813537 RepID=A0ABQ7MJU5_BRACM|nr:hypothetical protein IGI04_020816 [Brassica rapa subsp. trilocularis]
MEEELRDMKARKDYYNMLHYVADAQQGIPQLCPCGSITKEVVDEEDTYDYLPGKRYFICKDFENDGLHFRQPWVMGMQQEEKLLRECQSLKEQVRMLLKRVTELERAHSEVRSVTEPQERPMGVKAAKAAGKRKKLGKEEELGQLKEMMETKKQISNQSLLASLFAKTEPLSVMEEALKMKLLSEML